MFTLDDHIISADVYVEQSSQQMFTLDDQTNRTRPSIYRSKNRSVLRIRTYVSHLYCAAHSLLTFDFSLFKSNVKSSHVQFITLYVMIKELPVQFLFIVISSRCSKFTKFYKFYNGFIRQYFFLYL